VAAKRAEVEGKLQASQHKLRLRVLALHGVDDELQVLSGFAHRNAADAVVGTQRQHEHIDGVPGQHRSQALPATSAGFAAHAVVVHFIWKLLRVEALLDMGRKASGGGQAVARREAVAEEEEVFHEVPF
jgi:hypothetical protein